MSRGRSRSAGDAQIHDVEAVEQILAEGAARHALGHVAVGGGDDADVDLDRLGAADAVDLALLDGAQELGLEMERHLGDFVEQQGAAIGLLELADATRHRTGEGALLVAEQLALEQVLRDRGAVDRDERLVGARGFAVDVARQHLLAGAALAGDQDRGVGGRDLVGELDDGLHRLVLEDELVALVGDGGEHGCDQLGVGRQRQVFLGAGADRVDGAARIGADATGHDRRADALAGQPAHQQADVERDVAEDEVGAVAAAQRRQALLDVERVDDLGAARHRDLGGRADLALQAADDEETHQDCPALMISVMVTPSRSSTRTTSPRATSRSLT